MMARSIGGRGLLLCLVSTAAVAFAGATAAAAVARRGARHSDSATQSQSFSQSGVAKEARGPLTRRQDDGCRQVTCVRECIEPCGWDGFDNVCRQGGYTSPDERATWFGCQDARTARTPTALPATANSAAWDTTPVPAIVVAQTTGTGSEGASDDAVLWGLPQMGIIALTLSFTTIVVVLVALLGKPVRCHRTSSQAFRPTQEVVNPVFGTPHPNMLQSLQPRQSTLSTSDFFKPVNVTNSSPAFKKELSRTGPVLLQTINKIVQVDKTVANVNPGTLGCRFAQEMGLGLTISSITPGGSANMTGQIVEGAIVVAINGADVRNADMTTAKELLSQSNVVALELSTPPAASSTAGVGPPGGMVANYLAALSPAVNLSGHLPPQQTLQVFPEPNGGWWPNDMYTKTSVTAPVALPVPAAVMNAGPTTRKSVVVDQSVGVRPGSMGIEMMSEPGNGLRIGYMMPGGAADVTGQMSEGMCIQRINGADVSYATVATAQGILGNADVVVLDLSVPLNPFKDLKTVKTVVVDKDTGVKPGSLGCTLTPEPGMGLMVGALVQGASADLTGEVEPGMHIISVNGTDIRMMGMPEASALLKMSNVVVLQVEYKAAEIEPHGLAAETATQSRTVVVDKTVGVKPGSLGCKLAPEPGTGLRIGRLVPGGSAQLTGCIDEGDRIVTINGVDVREGTSMVEAIRLLNESELVELGIEFEGAVQVDALWTSKSVVVDKSLGVKPGSLGCKMRSEAGMGLRVGDMVPGASADLTGEIVEGMYIVTVNGVGVRNYTMKEAAALLKEGSDLVELELAFETPATMAATEWATVTVSVDKSKGVKPGSMGCRLGPTPGLGLKISNIVPGGAADLSGVISRMEKPHVIAVNGVDCRNADMDVAGPLITQHGVVMLEIEHEVSCEIPAPITVAAVSVTAVPAAAAPTTAVPATAVPTAAVPATAASTGTEVLNGFDVDEMQAPVAAPVTSPEEESEDEDDGKKPMMWITKVVSVDKSKCVKPGSIGCKLTPEAGNGLAIGRLVKGGAADLTGEIEAGSYVTAIDGNDTRNVGMAAVKKIMKASTNSIELKIKSWGEHKPFQAAGPRQKSSEKLFRRQIHRSDLSAIRILGSGHFGEVWLATQAVQEKGKDAVLVMRAVKMLKQGGGPNDRATFIAESELMLDFDHDNVAQIIGVCVQQMPWLAVIEFEKYGDLRALVKAAQKKGIDIETSEVLDMSRQAAAGCQYISELKLVHMDVAARNLLVGKRNHIKLADFGVTRPMMEGKNFYRLTEKLPLSVKWSAPEALRKRKFHEKSDVWSFGVVMWECFSYGEMPYAGLELQDTVDAVVPYLEGGGRLEQPAACPADVWATIAQCWCENTATRPLFDALGVSLVNLLAKYPLEQPRRDLGKTIHDIKLTTLSKLLPVNKMKGVRPGSLGCKMQPEPGAGVRVGALVPGGAADLTGGVNEGMLIVAINGTDVRDGDMQTVKGALLAAGAVVELELEFDGVDPDAPAPKPKKSKPTDGSMGEANAPVQPTSPVALLKPEDGPPTSKTVTVDKTQGVKPGSIGCQMGPKPGVGIRIGKVVPGAAADITGEIEEGMVITAIHGSDVRNADMSAVKQLLTAAGDVVDLKITLIEPLDPPTTATPPIVIRVDKRAGAKPGSLGCKLSSTSGKGLRISKMVPGASADVCGQLAEGMYIVAINGVNVRDATMAEAVPLLRETDVSELELDVSEAAGAMANTPPASSTTEASDHVVPAIKESVGGYGFGSPTGPIGLPSSPGLPRTFVDSVPASPEPQPIYRTDVMSAQPGNIRKLVKVDKMVGVKLGSVGCRLDPQPGRGLVIGALVPGGAAEQTHELAPGMVIVSVNGVDVRFVEMPDAKALLGQSNPLVLEIETEAPVLQSMTSARSVFTIDKNTGIKPGSLGVKFVPDVNDGLVISAVTPGGSADIHGLEAGMTVTAINGRDVTTAGPGEAMPLLAEYSVVVLDVTEHRPAAYNNPLVFGTPKINAPFQRAVAGGLMDVVEVAKNRQAPSKASWFGPGDGIADLDPTPQTNPPFTSLGTIVYGAADAGEESCGGFGAE